MADNRNNRNVIETPAPAPAPAPVAAPAPKHPLWQGVMGWLGVLFGISWAFPMDDIFEQIAGPALEDLEEAYGLASTHVGNTAREIRHWTLLYVYRFLGFTLLWAAVCGGIVVYGIGNRQWFTVAFGGGLWSAYVLLAWSWANASLALLTEFSERGFNLASATVGAILRKVGLATVAGNLFTLNLEPVRAAVKNAFVTFIVSVGATFALVVVTMFAKTAPWLSCSLFIVSAFAFTLAWSVGYFKKMKFDKGWELIVAWAVRIGIFSLASAILAAFVPTMPGTLGRVRDYIIAWFANPTMENSTKLLLAGPVVLGLVFFALKGWHSTNTQKSGLFWNLTKASVAMEIAMIVGFIAYGIVTPRQLATGSKNIQDSAVAIVRPKPFLEDAPKGNASSSERTDIAPPEHLGSPTGTTGGRHQASGSMSEGANLLVNSWQ